MLSKLLPFVLQALQSKTVWGGIIAIAASIFALTGTETQSLTSSVLEVVTAVGGFVSIVGRIVARKRIGDGTTLG